MGRGSGVTLLATISAIVILMVVFGGLLSSNDPASVTRPGQSAAPTGSPGASLAPTPQPSPTPTPDPAAEARRRCPTGAVAQALAAASASPIPANDLWNQGQGDPCAYLSVYIGRERIITDPLDPTSTKTIIELQTGEGATDPGGLILLAVTATGSSPIPPAPAEARRYTDGAVRFTASETFVWRLLWGDRAVLVDDGSCPAREVNLAIPDASTDRYVLRLRIADEGETLRLCNQPLTAGTAIARLETIKISRDVVKLPAPDPVELNPLTVSLRAAQGRWYNEDLIVSAAKRAAGPSGDPISFFFFLIGFGVAAALGSFAFWLLFLSGDRPPRQKGKKRPTRGSPARP